MGKIGLLNDTNVSADRDYKSTVTGFGCKPCGHSGGITVMSYVAIFLFWCCFSFSGISLPMSHILELHHLSSSMASKITFDGFLLFLEAILAAGHESVMVKVDHHGLVFMASD